MTGILQVFLAESKIDLLALKYPLKCEAFWTSCYEYQNVSHDLYHIIMYMKDRHKYCHC